MQVNQPTIQLTRLHISTLTSNPSAKMTQKKKKKTTKEKPLSLHLMQMKTLENPSC